MIITTRGAAPATDLEVAREVSVVLERRAALPQPPPSLTVSDAVALGIAGVFAGATESGRVLERFHRSGSANSAELIAAARFEQGYASAEGHAALYCLIGWARSRALEAGPAAAIAS